MLFVIPYLPARLLRGARLPELTALFRWLFPRAAGMTVATLGNAVLQRWQCDRARQEWA